MELLSAAEVMDVPESLAPAWELVVRGIRYDMLVADELPELLEHLLAERDFMVGELGFDVLEDTVDVRFLSRVRPASKQALVQALRALLARISGSASDGANATVDPRLRYTETRTERVEETLVGMVGGEQVAGGNSFVAEYSLPDGRSAEGLTMALYLLRSDEKHRVGAGSEVEIGGRTWTVSHVDPGSNGMGWVELQAEVPVDRSPARAESLDFLFSSRCQQCGGRTGWDGSVDMESGRPVVGTRCIRCPEHELLTGGAIEQVFRESTPEFTPGRGSG